MPKPPKRDHRIPLDRAVKLVKQHKAKKQKDEENGGYFDREAIDAVLAQPGVAGIRYYHGRNDDGTYAIVIVGVDDDGNDLASGVLMENHFPCPPACPIDSPFLA